MDLLPAICRKTLQSGNAYWCSCTSEEVDAMRESETARAEAALIMAIAATQQPWPPWPRALRAPENSA